MSTELDEIRAWVGPRPALAASETAAVANCRTVLDAHDAAVARAEAAEALASDLDGAFDNVSADLAAAHARIDAAAAIEPTNDAGSKPWNEGYTYARDAFRRALALGAVPAETGGDQ